jgi:hypothetical protein
MKRLRHPVRAIREPFGTAGLIVACVAIVLALTGAAFAAKGALTGKQKKEVEKIAKKYAGKPGAPGAAGAAGPAGPQGAAGANGKDGAQGEKGAKGDAGEKGAKGDAGTAGKSPQIVEEFDPGDPAGCDENGGVIYEVAESEEEAKICNGKEGQDGEKGDPWTPDNTLPPGATETGTWTVSGTGLVSAALSFPIPLSGTLFEETVRLIQLGSPVDPLCAGSVNNPVAAPGVLCIYYPTPVNASNPFVNPASAVENPDNAFNSTGRSGAILYWTLGPEPGRAAGSFAVTGCSEESGAEFPCPGF